jgi:DNA-binding LacI/PurR family transcriptional regulator
MALESVQENQDDVTSTRPRVIFRFLNNRSFFRRPMPANRNADALATPAPIIRKPRLTLKDVAAALDVSRTTVSNAFNRPEQLSEALRADILAKARELGYFGPDPAARALRSREVRQVAVVFHHDLSFALDDPLSIEFLRGVAQELDARGMTMQLIPKMGRTVSLAYAFQTTADALVVYAEVDADLAPEVKAFSKPIVLVDTGVAGVPSVRMDDRAGAADAMQHVLGLKPDRVLVLTFTLDERQRKHRLDLKSPRSGSVTMERSHGYVEAAHRLGFDLDHIDWLELEDTRPADEIDRVVAHLQQLPKGTKLAVLGMADTMALVGLEAARSVPGVTLVSLVGFDDIPAAAAAGLTTMRQDGALKGRLAVRQVLDGEKSDPLPFELVVRNT